MDWQVVNILPGACILAGRVDCRAACTSMMLFVISYTQLLSARVCYDVAVLGCE
jgi:hypothetical protein